MFERSKLSSRCFAFLAVIPVGNLLLGLRPVPKAALDAGPYGGKHVVMGKYGPSEIRRVARFQSSIRYGARI